jgi:2'-5' RNA ligase
MAEKIRSFIAVDVPEEIRAGVDPVLSDLSSLGRELKVVRRENLHFTVKFLGNISPEMLEPVKDCIRSGSQGLGFEMDIRGLGAFPNSRKPRVVWIGATCQGNEFVEMAREIDRELGKLGFDRERSYVPHLTVARSRNRGGSARAAELIGKMGDISLGRMVVDGISLKKSVLTPGGPVYSDLAVIGKGGQ